MKEKILVMGGGIAGLSVGINALLAGYECEIIEKNPDVGGCCSTYYRKGYPIDHCIHWLLGTNKETGQYKTWLKLHALNEDTTFFQLEHLVSVEYDGKLYQLSLDYKKSHEDLLKLAPEDKKLIDKFFEKLEFMLQLLKKVDIYTISKGITKISPLAKSMNIDRIDFAKKFKNKGMQQLFLNAQNGYCNVFFFIYEYACFIMGNAMIPSGGSYQFKENMKNYFLELGGVIHTNTLVTDFKIENKKVVEVIARDKTFRADYYVCAYSPFKLFKETLHKYYTSNSLYRKDRRIGDKAPTGVQVTFLVEGDISSWPIPYGINANNIQVGTKVYKTMMLRSYGYDKQQYTKNNKTVVCVLFDQNRDDYYYWNELDEEEYQKRKKRVADDVFASIYKRFPELNGKLELLDVYTPKSLKKWLGSHYGAYQSFPVCKKSKFYMVSPKVRKLNNFYITGHWTISPGGLPVAAACGDIVISLIKNRLLDKSISLYQDYKIPFKK